MTCEHVRPLAPDGVLALRALRDALAALRGVPCALGVRGMWFGGGVWGLVCGLCVVVRVWVSFGACCLCVWVFVCFGVFVFVCFALVVCLLFCPLCGFCVSLFLGVFFGFGFVVFSCAVSCVLMDFRLPS